MLCSTWLLPKLLRWEEPLRLAAEKASRSSLNHSSLALSLLLTSRCSSCTQSSNLLGNPQNHQDISVSMTDSHVQEWHVHG